MEQNQQNHQKRFEYSYGFKGNNDCPSLTDISCTYKFYLIGNELHIHLPHSKFNMEKIQEYIETYFRGIKKIIKESNGSILIICNQSGVYKKDDHYLYISDINDIYDYIQICKQTDVYKKDDSNI